MSKKVADMLSRIRSTLSADEIKTLQEMLGEDSDAEEGKSGASLEEVMQTKYKKQEAPRITAENYQGFESDPRFSLIEEGMRVLEAAERKEDWAELREAKEKYPRAAAFISALLVATAAGPDRHEAGIRAMDRLLNEDPLDEVMEELWKK